MMRSPNVRELPHAFAPIVGTPQLRSNVVREELAGLRLRRPLPTGLILLSVEAAQRDTIAEIIAGAFSLYHASTAAACQSVLLRHVGLAVLTTVPSATATRDVEALVALRQQFPHSAWIGLFEEGLSEVRHVATLGRSGITELVIAAQLHRPGVLIGALARGETESVAARIWRLAGMCVDDACASLLKPALRLAHEPILLNRLAEVTRMHERTLRKYCSHAGLPSPQWIIGWARCLVTAFYLEEPGRSISSISTLLDFKTPVQLANQIRRYTGLTATALRQQGALQTTGRLLVGHLRRARETSVTVASPVRLTITLGGALS
jgi:AraC-like DNA-binding protein